MQRLKRLGDDRGAVAVWVAILMVPLLIVAALAIDIGSLHADRQRLQTGADAAALGIAQQCAQGACGDEQATAQELVDANEPQTGPATARVVELDLSNGYVEVEASAGRELWFGAIAGVTEASQSRLGAAAWGYPTGGGSLPLTFSWCEILHYTGATPIYDDTGELVGLDIGAGAENVVLYSKSNRDANFHGCDSGDVTPPVPNGEAPAGGFGWLDESSGLSCTANETAAGGWFSSDTGNDHPDNCTAAQLTAMLGTTILVPIFDRTDSTGANAEYHIFGYIGFRFEGFYFGNGWASPTPPCGEPNRCISGNIVEFVDYESGFETSMSGPQLGSALVKLQLPEGG